MGLDRDEKPGMQAARRELGGGPMEEKSLPRGLQGRKKEIERFYYYCLAWSLSLCFLFLSSIHLFPPSRNSERRTDYLESKLGIDQKKKKDRTNPDSDGMPLPTTTTHRRSLDLCYFFWGFFGLASRKKNRNFHFISLVYFFFLHLYVPSSVNLSLSLYPFDSPNPLPFLLST